jgi:LysR family glycine cleavage system transcriptional activator/LysR family transcriptional regulator of beta-lactamase
LNGLRAFEAAARLGSFTAAATELHVTQAAVSQQVQVLEARLGFALFRRHANRLELTDQGRAFQPGLTEAFDAIAQLVAQVGATRAGSVLTVGIAPAFALHWLIPRLTRFNRSHPQIEVCVATGGATLPVCDDWTCTVRRGIGRWPGYIAEELFPTTLVPVCTPAVAVGLRVPEDLRRATLIIVAHLRAQWRWWFEAARLSGPIKPAGEVVFESSAMAMQAILDGVGVGICAASVRQRCPGDGPADYTFSCNRAESWYLAYRPIRQKEPALSLFRDWLHNEAELQREAWRLDLTWRGLDA